MTTVAVVIITRHRADMLRRCLERLAGERDQALSCVVVDNSDLGRTDSEAVVADFPWASCLRVEPCANFQTSTRNRGVAASQSDVVAFLDDDSLVEPGWLNACREGFSLADARAVGAVGGRILDPEVKEWNHHRQVPIYRIMANGAVADNCDCIVDHPIDVDHLRGCNYAVLRAAFMAAGGFDESLLGYGYEDLDLLIRVRQAGYRILYHCPMAVFHDFAPRAGRTRFDRQRQLGIIRNLTYAYGKNFGVGSFFFWRFLLTYRTGLAACCRKPSRRNLDIVRATAAGKLAGLRQALAHRRHMPT